MIAMRILLLLALASTACASRDAFVRHAKLAGSDVVAVAKAMPREWKPIVATAAAAGAMTLLDDEIADAVRHNDSPALDTFAEHIETFGGGNSDKVMAGLFLYGVAARNQRARAAAFDAFVSSIIASKAITPALKQLISRDRPGGGDDDAFPSNHATQAFAVATAIASHYDDKRWVRPLAYGIASSVAFARVYHDDHWASDVLAGAAIGTFVGRVVARTNRDARTRWTIAPVIDRDRVGFIVRVSASALSRAPSAESNPP